MTIVGVKDHKSSHVLRHSIEKNHAVVTVNDFKVIEHNYRSNVQKRKVAEALIIKQLRTDSCFETLKLIYHLRAQGKQPSWQWRHQNDVFEVIVVPPLLTLITVTPCFVC